MGAVSLGLNEEYTQPVTAVAVDINRLLRQQPMSIASMPKH